MSSSYSKVQTLCVLILLAAFPPLSTATYLPALPSLVRLWNTSESVINLTLVAFFLSFSLALLLYGPLSDRYGRKPVLQAGISLYVLACFICAQAAAPWQLITGRIFQGLGAAGAASLSLAITKDSFHGAEQERVLAHIAVIVALAPMLSPLLGATILRVAAWPGIFYTQMTLGLIALWSVRRINESAPSTSRTLGEVFIDYGRLLLNLRFMTLCVLIALGMMPLFCFTGGSSFIYINHFGLTEQVYSYFFTFNAASLMLGFWICTRLIRRMQSFRIIIMGYIGMLISSVALLGCSTQGPKAVAIAMACMTMSSGVTRPPSNHFLLEQVQRDAGSTASIIMFTGFICGALGVRLIGLPWPNKIPVIALAGLSISLLVLILLPRLARTANAAH
jgi:DHA1 family bicyclomycin/chloramphenicol resistance-like MFS transporter